MIKTSTSLKKHGGSFSELSGVYAFSYDKRNRSFMPTDGFITSFRQELPLYADRDLFLTLFLQAFINTYRKYNWASQFS